MHALSPLPPALAGQLERTLATSWLPLTGIDADDLRQEALLAYWQAAQRFQPHGAATLRTYGGYRLLGRVRDVWREATHRGTLTQVPLASDWDAVRAPPPDWTWLYHAVNQLPARERLIIIRAYWSGWPLARIARHLGCSESWTCLLRQQALRRLRVLLKKNGQWRMDN